MNLHIIILTKNKVEILFQCLDSIIEKTSFLYYYVWIADTGTSDDLKDRMLAKLSELNDRFNFEHRNVKKKNETYNLLEFSYYNFSKINNETVQYLEKRNLISSGDLLLFCNNDIKLIDDCISGCVETFIKLTNDKIKIGTLGIRLHFPDNTIQHCGLELILKNNRIRISHKNYRYLKGYITETCECIGVTGAFLVTPYDVFCLCGRFNENYIEGSQDIEYNLECIRNGYKNFILGQYAAYHYESFTRNDNKDKRLNEQYDFNTNLFPYIIKNYRKFKNYFTIVD